MLLFILLICVAGDKPLDLILYFINPCELWFIKNIFFVSLQAKYIAQCIEEIKQELRQENISVKANAVAKLTYVGYLIGLNNSKLC